MFCNAAIRSMDSRASAAPTPRENERCRLDGEV